MSFRVFEPSYDFIDERLNVFLGERLSSVIAQVDGPLRVALLLYVVLYGYAILRGSITEPMRDFAVRSIKLALLYALATTPAYSTFVTGPLFSDMPNALTRAVSGSETPSVGAAFDQFFAYAAWLGEDISRDASAFNPAPYIVAAGVFIIGALAAALGFGVVLVAKLALALLVTLGPIFIACALFDATRRYFFGWLSQAVNYLVLFALSPALIERVRSDREARRAAAAAEAARLRREMDVQAGLERLFALAERPTEDDAFSLAAWTRNSPVAPGRSLADLVMAGDADWRALLSGLSAIERMLEGGALTDELLGLPFEERLEEARRQAAWIVAQERAAQEEAERRARAGRMVAIREAAWAALNGEAEYWLSSPLAPGAACAIRTSEQSDEGLGAALGALRRHVAELEEAARKAVVIEGFQARLRQAAGASFEPARAEFFLNNRRPELGMATPLAYCVDERSLREAMSLLGSRSKR